MTTELPRSSTYDSFFDCLATWGCRTIVGSLVPGWIALLLTVEGGIFVGCIVVGIVVAVALAGTDFVALRRGATWVSDVLRIGWLWVALLQIAFVLDLGLGMVALDGAWLLLHPSHVRGEPRPYFPPPDSIGGAMVVTALFAVGKLVLLASLGGLSLLALRWIRAHPPWRSRRGPIRPRPALPRPTSAPRPEASR
jgi:hypothetical protein